jgi:hypothetical protein
MQTCSYLKPGTLTNSSRPSLIGIETVGTYTVVVNPLFIFKTLSDIIMNIVQLDVYFKLLVKIEVRINWNFSYVISSLIKNLLCSQALPYLPSNVQNCQNNKKGQVSICWHILGFLNYLAKFLH